MPQKDTCNWFGRLLEYSPFCERDYPKTRRFETYNERRLVDEIQKQDELIEMVYTTL